MAQQFIDLAGFIGLEDFLDAAPERTREAASIAMNGVIGGSGLAKYRRAIEKEVDFPTGYLNDSRFGFDQRAKPSNLTASLIARQRPTSLARFATSGSIGSKGGVRVKVAKEGGGGYFKSAFLIRLRAGGSLDDGNVGLAIRLKPGQTLNKRDTSRMVHLEANVVLLYGPSIDQVLNNGVAEKETPEVIADVATEFFRQFERLNR
jgi:hypothetical protein